MDNDRRRQIDELFQKALECSGEERDRLLSQAGQADKELEDEVRDLLRDGLEDVSLLQPVGAFIGSVWSDLISEIAAHEKDNIESSLSEEQIGPYRIVRQIGRGGMGAVYQAQRADTPDGQLVALKILAPGFEEDDLARRFEQERHILETLDHPAIARHIDGGVTKEGRPYLVLEHVEGQPIDIHCDRNRLTVEQRLRLFLEVARAVQYAHRCMVVHRDLKPSNILVTEDNHVKLLDFGIAKLLDSGGAPLPGFVSEPLTRIGSRIMTPEYASPEQVRGALITMATDVYQLGVLLYELLAGQRPYRVDGCTPAEIERVICEYEPVAPSSVVERGDRETRPTDSCSAETVSHNRRLSPARLRARLKGDLDTIVSMALRKEPERRYPSVDHLIQDLERHLEGHAISARNDTHFYRAGKFVRRHRIGLSAILAILVLTAISIGFYVDRRIAEHEQTRREAELSSQVVGFLEGMFDVAERGRGPGEAISARELLDHGVDQITNDADLQPVLEATLKEVLGDLYRKLGLFEQARPLLEEALETRRTVQGEDHPDVAGSLNACGLLYLGIGRYDDAIDVLQEALRIQHSLRAEESLLTARIQANLAEVYVATGDLDEAEPLFQNALSILERTLGEQHQEIAKTKIGLSSLYWSEGRFEEAEPLLSQALAILRADGDCNNRLCAIALSDLGQIRAQRGEYDEAEKLLQQGYSALKRLLGSNHPETAMSLKALARLKAEQGLLDDAEPLFEESLAILKKAHHNQHPDIGECLHDIALLHWDRGDYDKAELFLRRALAMGEATLGADHPDVAAGLNSLGALYWKLGRLSDAEDAYRRSLAIVTKALSSDHPHVSTVRMNLASVLRARGDFDGAIELYKQALENSENGSETQRDDRIYAQTRLARIYGRCGQFEQAEELFQQVLQEQEELEPGNDPDMAETLRDLCTVFADQGRYDEAASSCQRSIAVDEQSRGPNDPDVALSKIALAEVFLLSDSSLQRAESLLTEATSVMDQVFEPDSLKMILLNCRRAQLLHKRGKSKEAERLLLHAVNVTGAAQEQLSPDHTFDLAEAYLILGELCDSLGQHEKAQRWWNQALALTAPFRDTRCVRWRRIQAVTLSHLERTDEARPLVEKLLSQGYRHPDLE